MSVPDCVTDPRDCSFVAGRCVFCKRTDDTKIRHTTLGPLASKTEYAVLCPRDGTLRSHSNTRDEADTRATDRDSDCGMCRAEHGKHIVVSRFCSEWVPDDTRSQRGRDSSHS